MRKFLLPALVALCACDGETSADSATLPRPDAGAAAYWEPAAWPRTGKELLPLDNIAAELEPIWREADSCEQVGYAEETQGETYDYRLLYIHDRAARANVDLGCEMEKHGFYVSHVAWMKKDIWSDYENRFSPRLFTFFRIRSADGAADFALYHVHGYHLAGNVNLDGCDHDEARCWFSYRSSPVISLKDGLFARFPVVRRNGNDHVEDSGAVALLLGKPAPEVAAFVAGESDGVPRAMALSALMREAQRQYPEGAGEALDLIGHVRHSTGGIVIEDVGANFGLAGTDASYVIRLTDQPACEETENERVRQCLLKVKTSLSAYNRASGSQQTKLAQIANVAAAGTQEGEIEALFVREDSGWRMVVTEEIARFLSGVDRRSTWVVRTGDGRTLRGGPAVACIANPDDC